jgi:ABC-type branched-subunit amino acid transport system substrate-binding protein
MLYVGLPSDFANLVLAARQAAFTGPIGVLLAGVPTAGNVLQTLGTSANNLYFSSAFYYPPSPQTNAFQASMRKYAASDAITPLSEGEWLSIQTVAAAFKSSKSTTFTAAALTASLNKAKKLNIGPEAPPLNFTVKGSLATAPRTVNLDVAIYEWQNGALVQDGPFFNPYTP